MKETIRRRIWNIIRYHWWDLTHSTGAALLLEAIAPILSFTAFSAVLGLWINWLFDVSWFSASIGTLLALSVITLIVSLVGED